MVAKLTRWFLFGAVIASLPIWFNLYRLIIPGSEPVMLLIASCSHGEPLLVSAAISGAALGVLLGSGSRMLVAKAVAGLGCAVVLVLASIGFAYVAGNPDRVLPLDPESIALASLAMLSFGIVSSGSCIALAEYR
uniref:Uncharacterized protein n=1 Tax=Candidatus Kentrum sp. DK TaxID=2126562 RepID=A0A450S860_9GAMM|nr:MAG: hypothetical protein BECKDK2373B_GA0170837_101954 [Candidatus Kentron sp. DK]